MHREFSRTHMFASMSHHRFVSRGPNIIQRIGRKTILLVKYYSNCSYLRGMTATNKNNFVSRSPNQLWPGGPRFADSSKVGLDRLGFRDFGPLRSTGLETQLLIRRGFVDVLNPDKLLPGGPGFADSGEVFSSS
ncbi:hypothetical protein AOL_s00054g859 [Orbilia oligospora ATCC 24927]|uniref:Uncharacterized protein n=1 Tax=Arthrobotrys oligospora (strain ATCC 24927 / CBS 115.81 / DSM 1491) TaxID=756982 RepID=G1X7X3_ARTOA|nr:hypothetical protein AOL_s00054g859 [Orbilia oligospora ATCC 24927]EGX50773.1 hypothetical protein AOL_s00054g859 [Orbilia oligospora ATCC 24927]